MGEQGYEIVIKQLAISVYSGAYIEGGLIFIDLRTGVGIALKILSRGHGGIFILHSCRINQGEGLWLGTKPQTDLQVRNKNAV